MRDRNLFLAYQGWLTVSASPQPLSAEWGEDLEAREIEIYNPEYHPADGSGNAVEIVTGNQGSQFRQISPGGNKTVSCAKLSDIYVRTRLASGHVDYRTVRIPFEVYWERKNDAGE